MCFVGVAWLFASGVLTPDKGQLVTTTVVARVRRCVPHPMLPDTRVCREHGDFIAYHRQNGGWAYMGPVTPFGLQLPTASP